MSHNDDVLAWRRYLPVILNTVSSQNAAAREATRTLTAHAHSIQRLEQRIEFVRREAMLEAHYGGRGDRADEASEPRIVDPTKIARADGDIGSTSAPAT